MKALGHVVSGKKILRLLSLFLSRQYCSCKVGLFDFINFRLTLSLLEEK